MENIKKQAQKIIAQLPDEASWSDVMYEFYVRAKVEAGLRDIELGRVLSHDQVVKRLKARSKKH